jgi:uncharacterized protein (DUF2141 family)
MKKILLIIAIAITSIQVTNAQEKKYDLSVTITNLSSNEGRILLGVYNSEANFLKKTFKGDVLKVYQRVNMLFLTFMTKTTIKKWTLIL